MLPKYKTSLTVAALSACAGSSSVTSPKTSSTGVPPRQLSGGSGPTSSSVNDPAKTAPVATYSHVATGRQRASQATLGAGSGVSSGAGSCGGSSARTLGLRE